jgi:D-tyrosyl-tRNA(Tyr) deacylase
MPCGRMPGNDRAFVYDPSGAAVRALLQRVERAEVRVEDRVVGAIGAGLVALVAVTHDDTPAAAIRLAGKIHQLRILEDDHAVADVPGSSVLVVSQFTLYADTRRGRRPSWSAAAPAAMAEPLVDLVISTLRARGVPVATGAFGAHMRLELVNDGPVTLLLEV